jgi:Zn-dependent protease with chaperone function
MLRIPASFDLPHALDPETSYPYLAFVIATFLVSATASFVGWRRLRIAEKWARSGTFSENELLHNVATLLFPMQLLRLAGLLGVYQLGDESTVANAVGGGCLAASMICMVAVAHREHALHKRIRKTKASFGRSSTFFLRAFAGYGLLAFFSMTIGLSTFVTISSLSENLVLKTSVFLATVIFAQLALSPLLARIIFPNRRANGTRLESLVHEAFEKMKRPKPQVRILELDEFRIFNAVIVGLGSLPGPFRQSVFISEAPELSLTTEELKAVIHHELAHGHLNHLPLRIVGAVAINLALFLVFASLLVVLPKSAWLDFVEVVSFAIALIVVQPLLLGRLVRDQEKQADEFAVFKMGSKAHDLISALAKITLASGGLRDRKPAGHWLNAAAAHPTVDERQDHLFQLETQIRTGRMQPRTLASRLSTWRFRTAIARDSIWRALGGLCALALALLLVTAAFKPATDPSRTPASTTDSNEIEKYLRKLNR